MPFDYYHRLSRRDQAVYRKSDRVTALPIPSGTEALSACIAAIDAGLRQDDARATGKATRALADGLCRALGVPTVTLRVLKRRPSNATSELHGLYEREDGKKAIIRVWMRTAANARPVRLRTFVRTVLHELCHHIDYELLALADSFHTEGFFRRESSLARQLLPRRPNEQSPPERASAPKTPRQGAPERTASRRKSAPRRRQLSLPGL